MSKEMLEAFRILEEDKGIKKEDIIEAVTESLRSAYRRRYGQSESAAIEFNEKTGDFRVYTVREVVDEVFDSRLEISLKDALAISSAYELGDKIKFEEAPAEFGRVAAQSAKQTIMEKMRKQTRAITYNTYKEHEQEIVDFVKSKSSKVDSVQIYWDETQWIDGGNGTPQGGDEVIEIFGTVNQLEDSGWRVDVVFDSDQKMTFGMGQHISIKGDSIE